MNLVEKRLMAFIIDITIIGFLGFLLFSYLIMSGKFDDFFYEFKINWILTIYFVSFLDLLFLIKDITGSSFGKKIMKIKIVSNDNIEIKPSIIILIIRNVFLSLGVIELLVMLVRKDKRRIGDLVTNTKVTNLK